MSDSRNVVVRRAKATDAEPIAEFVNRALGGGAQIEARTVITRLGEEGFLLAEVDHVLTGLIGWHVENLVACVTDLLIWPAREHERIARALCDEMEAAALNLQAEAALLFLPASRFPQLRDFCRSSGYALRTVGDLPRDWQEMAHQAGRVDQDEIPVKQLRSERVARPL